MGAEIPGISGGSDTGHGWNNKASHVSLKWWIQEHGDDPDSLQKFKREVLRPNIKTWIQERRHEPEYTVTYVLTKDGLVHEPTGKTFKQLFIDNPERFEKEEGGTPVDYEQRSRLEAIDRFYKQNNSNATLVTIAGENGRYKYAERWSSTQDNSGQKIVVMESFDLAKSSGRNLSTKEAQQVLKQSTRVEKSVDNKGLVFSFEDPKSESVHNFFKKISTSAANYSNLPTERPESIKPISIEASRFLAVATQTSSWQAKRVQDLTSDSGRGQNDVRSKTKRESLPPVQTIATSPATKSPDLQGNEIQRTKEISRTPLPSKYERVFMVTTRKETKTQTINRIPVQRKSEQRKNSLTAQEPVIRQAIPETTRFETALIKKRRISEKITDRIKKSLKLWPQKATEQRIFIKKRNKRERGKTLVREQLVVTTRKIHEKTFLFIKKAKSVLVASKPQRTETKTVTEVPHSALNFLLRKKEVQKRIKTLLIQKEQKQQIRRSAALYLLSERAISFIKTMQQRIILKTQVPQEQKVKPVNLRPKETEKKTYFFKRIKEARSLFFISRWMRETGQSKQRKRKEDSKEKKTSFPVQIITVLDRAIDRAFKKKVLFTAATLAKNIHRSILIVINKAPFVQTQIAQETKKSLPDRGGISLIIQLKRFVYLVAGKNRYTSLPAVSQQKTEKPETENTVVTLMDDYILWLVTSSVLQYEAPSAVVRKQTAQPYLTPLRRSGVIYHFWFLQKSRTVIVA